MKIVRPEEIQVFPQFREFTPDEMQQAYALARAAFTVEDLLRYTDDDPGISADTVLAELEEVQRQADQAAL